MGLFDAIHDIDHKIDSIETAMESVSENERTPFYESQFSLYEEKYSRILEAQEKLDRIFESGSASAEDCNKLNDYLESEKEKTEQIIYPYITEAAKAINTVLANTELKEWNSKEWKRIYNKSEKKLNLAEKSWLRRRLHCLRKIYPDYISLKEMKKRKINQNEFIQKTKGMKPVEGKVVLCYEFSVSGKSIYVRFCIDNDKNPTINIQNPIDSGNPLRDLDIALTIGYITPINNSDVSKIISYWKKYKGTTDKEIKESVLYDDKIDECFEYVDMAVEDGIISRNLANYYKEYVSDLKEKENLLFSLEPRC